MAPDDRLLHVAFFWALPIGMVCSIVAVHAHHLDVADWASVVLCVLLALGIHDARHAIYESSGEHPDAP